MNKSANLIEKIIKLNNSSCPEFRYENPLLDQQVAAALSKSVVKLLYINPQTQQNKVHTKLRQSILENIRKICLNREERDHISINYNIVQSLLDCYSINDKKQNDQKNLKKDLDKYLIRKFIDVNIKDHCNSTDETEVTEALFNLTGIESQVIAGSDWFTIDESSLIIKNIWLNENRYKDELLVNFSIKFKSIIEEVILVTSTRILQEQQNLDKMLSTDAFKILINRCYQLPICFQMSCKVFNYVLIEAQFNVKILKLIRQFIVKVKSLNLYIASLYPVHLQSLVLLLDGLNVIPKDVFQTFIDQTLVLLDVLSVDSKSDLIMLLSHYPDWFDIYNKKNNQ